MTVNAVDIIPFLQSKLCLTVNDVKIDMHLQPASKLELFEKEAQNKQSKRRRLSHYFDDNANTENYTQYYDYDFIDEEEGEISDEDMLNADIMETKKRTLQHTL